MHSPMEQFEIKRLLDFHLGSLDASFTNSALWMLIAVALATVVFVFGMSRKAMVPGRLQSAADYRRAEAEEGNRNRQKREVVVEYDRENPRKRQLQDQGGERREPESQIELRPAYIVS